MGGLADEFRTARADAAASDEDRIRARFPSPTPAEAAHSRALLAEFVRVITDAGIPPRPIIAQGAHDMITGRGWPDYPSRVLGWRLDCFDAPLWIGADAHLYVGRLDATEDTNHEPVRLDPPPAQIPWRWPPYLIDLERHVRSTVRTLATEQANNHR